MLHQCLGITQKGEQCKKLLKCGGYCHMHTPKELDENENDMIDYDLVWLSSNYYNWVNGLNIISSGCNNCRCTTCCQYGL